VYLPHHKADNDKYFTPTAQDQIYAKAGARKNSASTVKSESIDSSGDKRDDEAYTHRRTSYLLVAYYYYTTF
jgi:hypothetical protein